METRILSNEDPYCAQHLLPSKLADLQDERLPTIYAAFAHDLSQTYEVFKAEIARWRVRWSMIDKKPSRLQDAHEQSYKGLYPCIFTIIGIILTMPPTSAACERSFSDVCQAVLLVADPRTQGMNIDKRVCLRQMQKIRFFSKSACD